MDTRRAAIQGGLTVLVVPTEDLSPGGQLTVPMTFQTGNTVRAVGNASRNNIGCSPWAFTKATRKATVRDLRALADFIEANAIPDYN